MNDLHPVALPALAGILLEQVHAFGLLGHHAAPGMEDLEWLAAAKIKPLNVLFGILEHVTGRGALPDEMPLLYHTAGWPADAPPAGYAAETTAIRGRDHIASLFAFWTLQIRDKENPESAARKLVRAALWIVRAQGLAAALRYVFALCDAGFVIRPAVAANAIWLLLDARRRVRAETDLPDFFLTTLPDAPDTWAQTSFRSAFLARIHPIRQADIGDELDLLCDLVADRIALARGATDLTGWIRGQARLGMAAREVLNVFRWAKVDVDLAYAGFAAQFDEIAADCGGFFLTARAAALTRPGDRLSPTWGMAGAMAAMATSHEPEWFDRILEERVIVPDALLATYLEHPRVLASAAAAEWQAPSPELVPIMARLIINDDSYMVRPVTGAAALLTDAAVRAAAAELGRPLDDQLAGKLAVLLRAMWSDQPGNLLDRMQRPDLKSFGGGFVPRVELDLVVTRLGLPETQLEAWLGALLAAVGMEHASSRLIDAINRAEAGDHSGSKAALDALLRIYPAFAPLRLERAINLDTAAQPHAAWDEMQAALLLDSANAQAWQSAGVILRHLRFSDDAAIAAAIAHVMREGVALNADQGAV